MTEPVERWVAPELQKILDTAEKDYQHPSFGLDDLKVMLTEAYDAGVAAGKPFVSVDPAMRFGRPTVNHTRFSVDAATSYVWSGQSPDEVAAEYDVTRPDVLVACWYAGKYGSKAWRRRWGAWAEEAHDALWHSRYDIPDPPDMNGDAGPFPTDRAKEATA